MGIRGRRVINGENQYFNKYLKLMDLKLKSKIKNKI